MRQAQGVAFRRNQFYVPRKGRALPHIRRQSRKKKLWYLVVSILMLRYPNLRFRRSSSKNIVSTVLIGDVYH
jgi:hypothetical protein